MFDPPKPQLIEADINAQISPIKVALPDTKTLPEGAVGCGETGSSCNDAYEVAVSMADGGDLLEWITL